MSSITPLTLTRKRRSSTPTDRLRRVRRVLLVAALLLVGAGAISWASSMLAPSNSSLSIRTVEWLRSNGLRGIVNTAENIYYTWEAPSKGGPALKQLPQQPGQALAKGGGSTAHASGGGSGRLTKPVAPPYLPPRIQPVIHPALRGEGVWRATFAAPAGTQPPVLITSYRPQAAYPQIVAGVAWINQKSASIHYYPGMSEPAVSLPSRGPEQVPATTRGKLVATFNSAFKMQDSMGGVVYNGHTYARMVHGRATIVIYRNGRVNVIAWPYGATAPPNVWVARQNLDLIVNHGRPGADLANGAQWGATVGNAVQVWRSAVGVDRHGNLLYAVANYQTVASLAQIMRRAGAVRAMEMDINAYWPSFITYRHPGAAGAANILPGMTRSAQRYLSPDDRDFFAVYLR